MRWGEIALKSETPQAALHFVQWKSPRYGTAMIREIAGESGERVQLCKKECIISGLYLSSIFYKPDSD
jgi:hypothetical protein